MNIEAEITNQMNLLEQIAQKADAVSADLEYLHETDFWILEKRLIWLQRLNKLIVKSKDKILATVSKEKSVSEFNVLMNEYAPIRLLIQYYIRSAKRILKDEDRTRPLSLNFANKKVVLRRVPMGVIGIISPFNYPFCLPLGPIISALLAGNGVLWKPSQETPETNKLIETLIKGSLWAMENIFQVLPVEPEYGQALVTCPNVSKIHFTGSVRVGWQIARDNAIVRLTPPTLELGGSNAAIVLEDADLEETARVIVWSRFVGLSCNSIKRVFVVQELYEKLWSEILVQTHNLRKHETLSKLSSREKSNYRRFIADYKERVDEKKHFGPLFHASTLWKSRPQILRVPKYNNRLSVLNEETFVPLLPIVSVKDAQEAVKLANDTIFGLGASIFTKDPRRFWKLAEKLDTASVSHNDALTEFAQPQIPFGGCKFSGWGYTHGPEGLLDLTETKIMIQEMKMLGFLRPLKLQLFPWTKRKMDFIKRWIEWMIRLS